MRFRTFSLFIGLFVYWVIGLFSPSASAQTMSNDNYILQLHDLDKAGGLGVSDQQTAKRKKEPNYKIQTGFSLTRSTTPFTFSISETIIYFGTLFPTNPIKRTNKLTVSNGSANGYLIIAFEDKELSALESSAFIPDTTCDNGLCSEARSAAWTNPLTYGFGYRCDNVVSSNCAKGFSEGQILIVPDGIKPALQPFIKRSVYIAQGPVSISSAGFTWPVRGIVSQFAAWYHMAIDITSSVGTPIVASHDGTVSNISSGTWDGGYGTSIWVDSGTGFESHYAHLGGVNVGVGDTVVVGKTVIGWIGMTGTTTGPHVHFEISKNGVLVNPLSYLQ